MKEAIKDITIKNKQGSKISKLCVCVSKNNGFPQGCFDYQTLTTNDLFDSVQKIVNVKTHQHHSHITKSIIGYSHKFCNAKVCENKDMLICIAHILFHFDMFFY